MDSILIRIGISAAMFGLGWLMDRRTSWRASMEDLYTFWMIQLFAFFTALEYCHGVFSTSPTATLVMLWVGQPVAAFFAGILLGEIKSFWRWLAPVVVILTAVLTLFGSGVFH